MVQAVASLEKTLKLIPLPSYVAPKGNVWPMQYVSSPMRWVGYSSILKNPGIMACVSVREMRAAGSDHPFSLDLP